MNTKVASEIQIPNAPPIPGLSFRHYVGAQDHALMAELVNASNEADGVPEASSEETMAHYYTDPKNLDPYKDVLLAEVHGEPACYSRVFWLDQDTEDGAPQRIYRSVTFMHPAWRRKGLGRAMLPYNEVRIHEIAAQHPAELLKSFEITVPDTNEGALVLLKRSGYQVIRHFFVMSCDLRGEIPASQLPAGLELRPAVPAHYRAIWDAIEEAFIDHWSFTPRNDEDYLRWLEHPEFDPTLWAVAWDGDQVAGAAVNLISESENQRLGRNWAWTEPIAVRRPWRKRGLGLALLLESQRVMKARGMQGAALEVDVDNPNKALHLYESCGYRSERRWDMHRKEFK